MKCETNVFLTIGKTKHVNKREIQLLKFAVIDLFYSFATDLVNEYLVRMKNFTSQFIFS